jgi:hypothetical protein
MAQMSELQRKRELRYVTIRGAKMWVHDLILESVGEAVMFFPDRSRGVVYMKKGSRFQIDGNYIVDEVVEGIGDIVGADPLVYKVKDDEVMLRRR